MNRLAIIGTALAAFSSAHASILVNGSFELPGSTVFNQFNNGQVPGWNAVANKTIELGVPAVYGVTAVDGLNIMEIDSTENVTVTQTVSIAAGAYNLSFIFARRGTNMAGKPSDTCDFDVLWNNSVIAHLSPSSTAMTTGNYHVSALNGTNSLSFRGSGTSDGFGALIDKVDLAPVPEPSLIAALGLSALATLKRKKSRAGASRM